MTSEIYKRIAFTGYDIDAQRALWLVLVENQGLDAAAARTVLVALLNIVKAPRAVKAPRPAHQSDAPPNPTDEELAAQERALLPVDTEEADRERRGRFCLPCCETCDPG